ncbi:TWiK family of potassium channels protein 7 [Toxocara canis]|uniref:TWiK family of potassium channels protein 7 n=1 Tax=Toxocara canis TaxID=6265 RepID=A0A0B2VBD0_TOXCA|nr:TWiK family of potassium channels protein 7 [Toxocara canis]
MVLARRLEFRLGGQQKCSAIGIHFVMVGLLLAFMTFGSVIFMVVEGYHEGEQCNRSKKLRRNAAKALIQVAANHTFGITRVNRSEINRITDEYISLLFKLFAQSSSLCKSPSWTFANAFFFTSTTLTTIGYGNHVPVTSLGRALLVLYGLIGVPLALVTIGDISKFVATLILHVYVCLQRRFGAQSSFIEFNSQSLSVLLIISAIYPMTVGLLPLIWEPSWSIVETIYFSLISTFSIGYGDVMPSSPFTFTLTALTVLVGLLFNSVLVDLLGGYCIQQATGERWLRIPYIDEQSAADDL